MAVHLNWIKCQGDVWCQLGTVNLEHPHFSNMDGVYIIWHGGPNAAVVYVGQGNIRSRLTEHRTNQQIQAFSRLGLFVTWAAVAQPQRDGVECYLFQKLNPIVPERCPNVQPVEVNLPW